MLYVLLPGMLVVAALVAAGAAFQGSKWWLLALVGPASGVGGELKEVRAFYYPSQGPR